MESAGGDLVNPPFHTSVRICGSGLHVDRCILHHLELTNACVSLWILELQRYSR